MHESDNHSKYLEVITGWFVQDEPAFETTEVRVMMRLRCIFLNRSASHWLWTP